MTDSDGARHREYYHRRASQERDAAERTGDATAKRIHLDLADRYSGLAADSADGDVTGTPT